MHLCSEHTLMTTMAKGMGHRQSWARVQRKLKEHVSTTNGALEGDDVYPSRFWECCLSLLLHIRHINSFIPIFAVKAVKKMPPAKLTIPAS